MIAKFNKLNTSQKTDVNISGAYTYSPRVTNVRIKVICGPMFSGKTKGLISAITAYQDKGGKVLVFKPKMDARYSENSIMSHDKVEIQATNVVQPKEILDLFHHK